MGHLFQAWSAPMPTTAPPAKIALSAAATKTIQQVKPNTREIAIVEWGYTLDAPPATPIQLELLTTGTVAATVTAYGANDVIKYTDPASAASTVSVGTTASGYNATAEGTVVATRVIDYHYETGLWLSKQYPLAREPVVLTTDYLRVRATPGSATTINIATYVIWEE
jgi:hypothetical protein